MRQTDRVCATVDYRAKKAAYTRNALDAAADVRNTPDVTAGTKNTPDVTAAAKPVTGRFAVIDTETTWRDDVMSIGIVVADAGTFEELDRRYFILTPFIYHGGMYSDALYIEGIPPDLECSRQDVIEALIRFLRYYEITEVFAYNANFDYAHLPELCEFEWYDIMRLAAYRQYNGSIPHNAECYGTGRLKRGYGVESVYRMLSDDFSYCERHNALTDAVDELRIMKLLNHDLTVYSAVRIN